MIRMQSEAGEVISWEPNSSPQVMKAITTSLEPTEPELK
jgi:hypothetical protein